MGWGRGRGDGGRGEGELGQYFVVVFESESCVIIVPYVYRKHVCDLQGWHQQ